MKTFITKQGVRYRLPLFLPVYQPVGSPLTIERYAGEFAVEGCIVNAFFLYKNRELRLRFEAGLRLKEFLGFEGLVVTDSGAFQGFSGPLYLSNKKIIRFQDLIRTDVASPLDLITPPGDNRVTAERKWLKTRERIAEMIQALDYSILAGVQQGGRFLDLRKRSAAELVELGVEYLAIGSLVPFFNRRHDLEFVGRVLRDARSVAGDSLPIHVYGAGDPLELPFMAALGADIFDSSSYIHYAKQNWYMTPYGSFKTDDPKLTELPPCSCPWCSADVSRVYREYELLCAHNLYTITSVIAAMRDALADGTLAQQLQTILLIHTAVSPESLLGQSWRKLTDLSC